MFYFLSWQVLVTALALEDKAWGIANKKGCKQKYLLEVCVCAVCTYGHACMFFCIYSDWNVASEWCESLDSCNFAAATSSLQLWWPLGFTYKVESMYLSAFGKGKLGDIHERVITNRCWLSKLGRIINVLLFNKTLSYLSPLFTSSGVILCS